MKRILATLITSIALALSLTAFAGAPAHADYSGKAVAGSDRSSDAAKVKRRVTINFKPATGSFQFTGYVKPAGKCASNKIVRLQYKAKPSQAWKIFRNGRSNSNGFYAFRNLKQAGYFRAVAPKQFKCNYAASRAIKVIKQ